MSDASQRYSPQLQKEALARRESTQQGFVDFTTQLKEASKSNKSSKPFPADVPRQLKAKMRLHTDCDSLECTERYRCQAVR
jgi:hypothetical protein